MLSMSNATVIGRWIMFLTVHTRTYAYVLKGSRSRLLGEDVTVTVQQEAVSGDRRRILIPENIQILFLVF